MKKQKNNKNPAIKKNEGGQPDNKNAEKWTEEKALALANELIDWLAPKIEVNEEGKKADLHAANIFKLEFLALYKRLDKSTIDYLCNKFKSFSDLIKITEQMQEAKLLKYGSANKLNAGVTCFVLKNHHGYTDKIEHTGNENAPLTFIVKGIKPKKRGKSK